MSENTIKPSPKEEKEEEEEDNFCTRRTRTEILLTVALVGMISYFIYFKSTLSEPTEVVMCDEPACFESFLEINDFIDPSIDPCTDFHQFVCGNFFQTAFAKHVSNPLLQEFQRINHEVTSFIVEPISGDDSKQVVLQKKFFQTCLNTEAIEADQDETFFSLIEEIGGWPVLKGQTWQEEEFDWMTVMIKCKQLGLPFRWFLELGLYADEEKNYLKITYPHIENNLNKNYGKFMNDVVISLSGSAATAKAEMEKVLQFERSLLNVSRKNEANISLKNMTELQELYPKYNWFEFFNNMTEGIYEFSEETQVATNIDSYIAELDHLLVKTSRRVQANYIVWNIIQNFLPFLSHGIRSKYENFKELEDPSRIEQCVTGTSRNFPRVAETEYIRKYATARKTVRKISDLMKEEFIERLEKAVWIKNDTLKLYLDQYTEMTSDIGGRAEIFDEEFFDENVLHIGNLSFTSDNLTIVEMISERWRCYYDSLFSAIGKSGINIEQDELYRLNLGTEAVYEEMQNRLIVPAPILHGSLYDEDRPKYLNFGSLGSVIGRGLVQSFLDQLKEHDNIEEIWSHKDYKVFENGTKCFEDDYSRNWKEESSRNASEVIQEVISEVIGRDLAYVAYQKWREGNEEDTASTLLSTYKSNQLFWIKASLSNCYKKLIDEDDGEEESAIAKYRNILSARHSAHFANDFNCSSGSPMNPKNSAKCWSFL